MFFYILRFSLLSFSSLNFWDRFLCNWFSSFLLSLMYAFHIRNCHPNPQAQLQWNPLWFDYIHALITYNTYYTIRSDQMLSHVRLFATPWIEVRQASLSITNSRSSLKLTSIESVMPSSHLILCCPLLLPSSLPASGSFPVSQLFAWGGQSTVVSASASSLPKKSQGWSPLEWTGWISLQSKGLSRVFSNTTDQKHQFFGTQLSSQSNSHIHTWPLEKP